LKGDAQEKTTGTQYIRRTVVKAFSDSTSNTNPKTDETSIGRVKLLMVRILNRFFLFIIVIHAYFFLDYWFCWYAIV
jgi:hypothetical protein